MTCNSGGDAELGNSYILHVFSSWQLATSLHIHTRLSVPIYVTLWIHQAAEAGCTSLIPKPSLAPISDRLQFLYTASNQKLELRKAWE